MLRLAMNRRVLIALAAAIAVALGVGILQTRPENGRSQQTPLISPAEARQRLAGAPAQLGAIHEQSNQLLGGGRAAYERRVRELRGTPIVVNKWGSWCGPCREEFPLFNRASVEFGREVAFLGVDSADSRSGAFAFLENNPVSYPSYFDPAGRLSSELGGEYYPSTVFYDSAGAQQIHQGPYTTYQDLADDIRRYALTP